jgi:hypothetical protein
MTLCYPSRLRLESLIQDHHWLLVFLLDSFACSMLRPRYGLRKGYRLKLLCQQDRDGNNRHSVLLAPGRASVT